MTPPPGSASPSQRLEEAAVVVVVAATRLLLQVGRRAGGCYVSCWYLHSEGGREDKLRHGEQIKHAANNEEG